MDPYIGEIKLWALPYVPQGWALCDGSLLPISQNQALYNLISTRYGGDGKTSFGLPDLRGRVPVPVPYPVGSMEPGTSGGEETVTLTTQQVPPHTHQVNVYPNTGGRQSGLGHHIAAPVSNLHLYSSPPSKTVALNSATVSTVGGGLAHDNMQPWLALNYFIATDGLYPPHP